MISAKVADQISQTAVEVARLYRRFVETEDVAQVMWVWVLEHASTVEDMPPFTLRRRLKDAGITYCRKEKAHKTGYHPDDEYTYSQPVLLKLLPDAFDPHATRPVNVGTDGGTGGSKGEHTYLEWETMLIDVRVGLDKLGYADHKVLKQVAEGSRAANDVLAQDALRRLQRRCNSPG